MQLIRSADGRYQQKSMTIDTWTSALTRIVEYRKTTEKEGDKGRPIPEPVIATIRGDATLNVPVLQRVIGVPVFSPSGNLNMAPGYDPETGMFLVPELEILPIPYMITEEHVQEALFMLADGPLRDFGFTDVFGGAETLPLYADEVDEDGYPLPNLHRGAGSRSNMAALLLHPFAVYMIKGPKPSYHSDKSVRGEGAGKLANVAAMIREGKRMTPRTLSHNQEEIKKAIVSARQSGASALFWDNVPAKRNVDSETIASYETAEEFAARILGISQDVYMGTDVPMIFAGNNVRFSDEAYRRKVPIRIDAGVPEPTERRVKHDPLEEWLATERSRLVWAVHVLIMNWVRKGCPKPQRCPIFASFTEYRNVIGGILEAAGEYSFLSNREAYLAAKNDDGDGVGATILRLLDKFPNGRRFTARDAYLQLKNPLTGRFEDCFITVTWGRDEVDTERSKELSAFIRAELEGRAVVHRGKVYRLVLAAHVSPKEWASPKSTKPRRCLARSGMVVGRRWDAPIDFKGKMG